MNETAIHESYKIHDSRQFEMKQDYTFTPGGKNEYHMKTWLFIPKNFRIDGGNYSPENFFNDLHSYIRFKTPAYSLDYLLEKENHLENYHRLAGNCSPDRQEELDQCINHIKLFSLIFKKSMESCIVTAKKSPAAEAKKLAESFLAAVPLLRSRFDAVRHSPGETSLPQIVMTVYDNCDEYIGMKIHSSTGKMLTMLQQHHPEVYRSLRKPLMQLLKNEIAVMKSRGFIAPEADSKDGNLLFIHRQGRLKKIINSVLFLETRFSKSSVIIQQMTYSIAAGIAMIFATTVVFLGQNRFGDFSYPFFVAVVVSYMFKDRIKDLLKIFLNRKINTWLYDRVRNVLVGSKNKIGYFKESANYTDYPELPEAVKKIRNADHKGSLPIKEEIIFYRKFLRISPRSFIEGKNGNSYTGIVDIMRLNVSGFIRNLDDPEKELLVPSGERIITVRGKRVYRLNVITHYRTNDTDYYRRLIISLTSRGIEEIVEIPPA